MRSIDILLWVVVPYVCLAVFVGGHVWRYRYDKFGWTTRSSQLYESRLLRLGSPLFHFGILFVLMGHVMGLAHIADRVAIMQPNVRTGAPAWSAGDLSGLRRVGRSAGCLPPIPPQPGP